MERKENWKIKLQDKMDAVNSQAILKYGIRLQSTVCMEELAELTQQISKQLRGKGDKAHLAEEIADVYICLDMLRKMYGVDSELLVTLISYKLDRTKDRMTVGE